MASPEEVNASTMCGASNSFDAVYKLPREWRYLNISVFWIPEYRGVIRLFYLSGIRHEIATALSWICGLLAGWLIYTADSRMELLAAAVLVHFKDVFDATDGALARLTGTGHRLGRFLDTIGDGVVFSVWITAVIARAVGGGFGFASGLAWGIATWLSLFLQCSYFNFHQLHYIRLSGARSESRLDERDANAPQSGRFANGVTSVLAVIYDAWFGWQDRLIARLDRLQRHAVGMPDPALDPQNDRWYTHRGFMVANSVLCFGTHAFILVIALLFGAPFWFLPAVVIGLNLYWLGIVLGRQVVFRGVR